MLKTSLFNYQYVPAKIKLPEEKLVLVFHGLGDSLNGFLWLPSELNLDELSYFFVNAPDSYFGGYSWYDFMDDSGPGIIRSRPLIFHLIDELCAQGVKTENLFLFGFSQGSLMAMDVGLRLEHKLAGVCGVSGYVYFMEDYPAKLSPQAKEQNFLTTHGVQDPVVPFSVSKQQYGMLKDMGLTLTFITYQKDHTILPQELIDIQSWFRERLKAGRNSN